MITCITFCTIFQRACVTGSVYLTPRCSCLFCCVFLGSAHRVSLLLRGRFWLRPLEIITCSTPRSGGGVPATITRGSFIRIHHGDRWRRRLCWGDSKTCSFAWGFRFFHTSSCLPCVRLPDPPMFVPVWCLVEIFWPTRFSFVLPLRAFPFCFVVVFWFRFMGGVSFFASGINVPLRLVLGERLCVYWLIALASPAALCHCFRGSAPY